MKGDNMNLIESSLGRLKSHADKGFFIISAFRGDNEEKVNVQKHKQLQSDRKVKAAPFNRKALCERQSAKTVKRKMN
jgi:hypothetical protein